MPGGTGSEDAVVDVWVARLDAPTDVPEPLAARWRPRLRADPGAPQGVGVPA